MSDFSTFDKANEAEREYKLRQRLYPKWITEGTLSGDFAERRLAIMKEIAGDYRAREAWELSGELGPGSPETQEELRAAVTMAEEMAHKWAAAWARAKERLKTLERHGAKA